MFKKKRLALLATLAILIAIGVKYSPAIAIAIGLSLAAAMGLLALYKFLVATRGVSELEQLAPRYAYPILIENARARTAPDTPLRIAVLGDTRNNRKIAARVYEQIAQDTPAAVFHTGDIIRHGAAAEYLNNHIALLEKYIPAIPVFCVPGNHERGARRDFATFRALYGATRFAFELHGTQFIGFNNSGKGRLPQEDFDWLRATLEASQATHRFVFFHIPPAFFEATFVNDARRRGFTKRAEELHELFQKHNVNEVFMAHIHGYASTVRDTVRYTLTAGGGAPLSHRIVPENRVYHYLVLHIENGQIRREVIRLQNGAWQRATE